MSSPPVTRLLDYGQFKYEQARQEKEARRHQRSVEFKEIRLRVKIGKGDFDTKVRRAIEFLEDGDRVKVTVQFRGREVSHAYIGRDLLERFADQVGENGTVESPAAARRQQHVDGDDLELQAQTACGDGETEETATAEPQVGAARRRRAPVARTMTDAKDEDPQGSAKRFGVSGTGKVMRVKAWSGHHLDIKSSSRTRRYAGKADVDGTSAEQVSGCCRT